jgi:hypothetical protein
MLLIGFARIGVMRALNRHIERAFNPDRKDHHWGRRKLARPMTKAWPPLLLVDFH